ncbi:MAG: hypothetical protein JEZ07_10065 [Phycisphaerae bacterium]|nr:hypothetical protein [Phycisphaerae bacterium]
MYLKKLFNVLVLAMAMATLASAELVMHATFDEVDGKTAVGGYDIQLVGGTAVTTGAGGIIGEALQLDGVIGSFAQIMTYKGVLGNNARTTCLWVKTAVNQSAGTFFLGWGDGGNGSLIRYDVGLQGGTTDMMRVEYNSGFGNSSTGTTITDDVWHHIAVVHDGVDTTTYYLDGVAYGTSTKTLNTTGTSDLCIGTGIRQAYVGNTTARWTEGLIDDVRIYDTGLTAVEIVEVMNAGDAAGVIAPANGAERIAVDTDLQWAGPSNYVADEYKLYFYEGDPNSGTLLINGASVAAATEVTYDLGLSLGGDLKNSQLYSWRVESKEGTTWHTGAEWSFTTIAAVPIIDVQPTTAMAAIGQEATFGVEGLNIVGYSWRKMAGEAVDTDNDPEVSTDAVLSIVVADLADDGKYYCVVDNGMGDTLASDAAQLYVARRVIHCDFETGFDGVDDNGDTWTVELVDPNELDDFSVIAGVTDGAVGNCAELEGASYLQVVNSEEYFNFYPLGMTANIWIKSTVVNDAWNSLLSKHINNNGWVVNRVNAYVNFTFRGASAYSMDAYVDSEDGFNDGIWHMVTIQHDAVNQTSSIFVDGIVARRAAQTNEIRLTDNPVKIGTNNDGTAQYFAGLVDELSIWNYALTEEEIGQMYVNVTGETICTSPVLYDFGGGEVTEEYPNGQPDCIVNLVDFAIFVNAWMDNNFVGPQD